MRAVIYTANAPLTDIIDQHKVLSQYAEQHTMKIVRSFSDTDIWNKPAKSISGLISLVKSAEERVMELVLVHDMALFGTSISHMLNLVQVLSKHKVGVYFYKQCISTHGETGHETMKVLSPRQDMNPASRYPLAPFEGVKDSQKMYREQFSGGVIGSL